MTLVEREAVDAVRADGLDLTEADTRRNLVTEGVALNHLVGCTFRIGAVRLRGLRLAEPCAYLEQLTGLTGSARGARGSWRVYARSCSTTASSASVT